MCISMVRVLPASGASIFAPASSVERHIGIGNIGATSVRNSFHTHSVSPRADATSHIGPEIGVAKLIFSSC